MQLLEDRNLTARTYDEDKPTAMEQLINHKYYPILLELLHNFNQRAHAK
jgi:hypothetical protein